MAVVGHAYVVVRAITDGVDNDIRRAFSGSKISAAAERGGALMSNSLVRGLTRGMKDIDQPLVKASRSFSQLNPEAERLRKTWINAMRAGYLLQGALGALGGSISAVIGGLASLIGAAGGAASALVAVGSAAITARVGLGVAQFALGGIAAAVKSATDATGGYSDATADLREQLQQLRFDQEEAALSEERAAFNLDKARQNMLRVQDLAPNSLIRRDAELAFKEAELAYRRAKDRAADLKDQVAPDNTTAGGGADPFAGLTPSQREFAEYLVSIQGIFKDLREAAASGFLPILQDQIERIVNSPLLGILETRFNDIGKGAGLAVKNFTDALLDPENLNDLNEALGDMAEIMPSFGTILGNAWDAFLSIIVAADPLTRRFVKFLEDKTGSFAAFLDAKQATGELEAFFNRAGDIAADFGTVFGNIFGFLGDTIAANFGPGSGGDKLLQWLIEVSDGWNNIDKFFLDSYYDGVAENFMAIGDALGGAIDSLLKAGSNPAIKAFWDALDEGSYAFERLINNFVETAPKFGQMIKLATEIMEVFSDTGQVDAFFGVINTALTGVKDLMVGLRPIIDIIGPILATVSAITLLAAGVSKLGLIFGAMAAKGATAIGTVIALLSGQITMTAAAEGATVGLRAAITGLMTTNPLGWIALVVAGIAAVAVAIAGVRGEAVERATKGVTEAFDTGTLSLEKFGDTIRTVSGPGFDYMADSTENLKASVKDLGKAQESFWGALTQSSMATTNLADSFGAVGRSLASIATTNLPKAQAGFQGMKKELGLNNEEMIIALDEMDEFKDALVDQADQLGINVYDLEGNIDKHKLLEFALGKGEIAARNHAAAQAEISKKLEAQRQEIIKNQSQWETTSLKISGWDSAIKDAMEEGEFSLEKALSNMETAIDDSTELQKDMLVLKQRGLSDAALNMIKETGEQAPALVEALLGASEAEFKKFDDMAKQAALQLSDTFSEAKMDLINSWADGKITDTTFDALYDGLEAATSPAELKEIRDKIAAAVEKPFTMSADINLSEAKRTLEAFQRSGLNITGYVNAVDRGYTGRAFGATGGYVSGPGTGTSDSVPAMLSNGEYVINAKSTSKYRNLLARINAEGNKFATGGLVSGNSGAGISITVNPSPGMDEKQLAAAVSRELAFQIRKGSI